MIDLKTKELKDYFEFLPYDAIRIKGHRVGIELILEEYKKGLTPEAIVEIFPTLSREDVYATITYYWLNREQLDAWLREIDQWSQQDMAERDAHPSPVMQRLRAMQRGSGRSEE